MANSLMWVKASYSGSQGNCVEVAVLPDGGRAVRDSKDASGPILRFSADQWRAFTFVAKAGTPALSICRLTSALPPTRYHQRAGSADDPAVISHFCRKLDCGPQRASRPLPQQRLRLLR